MMQSLDHDGATLRQRIQPSRKAPGTHHAALVTVTPDEPELGLLGALFFSPGANAAPLVEDGPLVEVLGTEVHDCIIPAQG